MAVTSWFTAGTCANDTGTGTAAWASDDAGSALVGTEASSDNNVYAGVTAGNSVVTNYLKCTNFGITSSDVPSGATINGIEIEIRQFRTTGGSAVASDVIKFVKGGTISGNNIGVTADWATTETATNYGSSTELGGLSWTDTDVTSSNFGCALSVTMSTSRLAPLARNVLVDQVRMRINYTTGGGGGGFTPKIASFFLTS